MTINNPSVDGNFYTFREYDYFHIPSLSDGPCSMEKFMIRAAGQKCDLFELADRCMEIWQKFLEKNGLLTTIEESEQLVA